MVKHFCNIVVVKHFCNTLFEKFIQHIWLQMVFSNHCMNEGGHDYTIHHFCNTLFEKFIQHIWLQMVFSNHCMNEGGHDYTIHTHSDFVLHLSWLHRKNDWDISVHFLVYYRNAPSVHYHKDSLPYSCFDKFPYFHNNG